MAELLIELFSEEIPARLQRRAADDLKRLVTEMLGHEGLAFEDAVAMATPRRLALVVKGLPTAQADVKEERRGPRLGAPDKAIEGFLRGAGITLDQTEVRETKKGSFYFAVLHKKGRASIEVLAERLPGVIVDVPWPKSMRWGRPGLRWIRPLHAILCLFDGQVVPFRLAHLAAGNVTHGHRFMAPASVAVTDFADYSAKLRKARVLLDPAERRAEIVEQAQAAASERGLALIEDEALVDEVAGLVEWPVVLIGQIGEDFMALPPEVLKTAMRTHQKYFSLARADGALAAQFAMVANLIADDDGAAIIAGNERVLRARLADADFFWNKDRNTPLEARVPALENVVYHARLGSMADKVDRIQSLAAELAPYVDGADRDLCRSAAWLAKADLLTEMVGEFPELQGIMGRYYALSDGERPEVADAIAEHYSPLGPGDACPSKPVSVAVALADKIDTLCGFWAIGEKPTGSKDPFALRRAGLGVIRLIVENGIRLSLRHAFELGLAPFAKAVAKSGGPKAAGEDLLRFIADRLKAHLRETGVRHDHVAAVFELAGEDDLVRLLARVAALASFLESEDGGNLLVAYRRAANILRIEEKKDGVSYAGEAAVETLYQSEERDLYARLIDVSAAARQAVADEDFTGAMRHLASLRRPVDLFFDQVTVNSEDLALRKNRLHLLSQIRQSLHEVADFSKIEG